MRSFFLLGTLPMVALAARTYPALLISRTYETGGGDEGYGGEHGPGYETGTGTCEDRGLQECGDGCIALDQICCPDELGGCPISDTCQLGENGQYGCCPEGKTCTGDGSASTTTITDVVIVTATSTEPAPESTSTDKVISTTDGYVVESTTTSETSTQVTEPTVSETSTHTPEETSTTEAPSGTTKPTAVESSTEASETEASTSVSATETATTDDITATITASSVSSTSETATEDISTTTYIPTNSSTYSPGMGSTTTYGFSTSTVYATTTLTITSCAPTITKCPAGHGSTILITKTIAVSTTLCPITTTDGPYPVPTSSKAPGGGHGHGGDGNDGPGNGGHGGNGGNGGHGGHSGVSPVIKPTYACALGYSCAPGAPQLTKTRTFTPIGTGKPGYSGPLGTGKPGYTGPVGGQPSTTSRVPVTGGGAKVAGNFGVAVVVALLAFAL